MAEEEAVSSTAGGAMEFLKKKAGPFPVIVWLVLLGGAYLYLKNRSSSSTSAANAATGANQQTDPAGNVGSIDPATGYVYGTPEDQAAQAANDSSTGTGTSTGSTGSSTVAGNYADNNAWAEAAINYLVGIGIDPTSANSAIEQYLASQSLTTQQQADVNEAIQRIGAPPSPPQPGTSPSPIVSPPSVGTAYATNPPTGLTVSSKAPTTIGLKWNSTVNATGYTISYGTTAAANTWSTTASGTSTSVTIGNLKASTLYYFRVQATPAQSGAGAATTSASTTASSTAAAPAAPPKTTAPTPSYTEVTVAKWTATNPPWNSTLSGIAAHYHTTTAALTSLNHLSNPNNLTVGQKIKVPT